PLTRTSPSNPHRHPSPPSFPYPTLFRSNHMHHLSADLDSPQRSIERQERQLQVRAAIDKLSPDLRECLILRDIDELSYQEIVDRDRKSTRLNSSHQIISYAVFSLKKKKR